MMMKDLDVFLPHILPYAPGCAVPTAYFGIRQAATEFCERTRLWRYEDEFTVEAGESEAITAPIGSVVHQIELVRFDGADCEPVTVAWLDANRPGWRTGEITGASRYVTQLEPNTIRLVPAQAGTVSVSLWLKPAQDCDDLPAFLADQYRQVIAHGALAHILAMPGEAFTNFDLSAVSNQIFQSKLDALSWVGSTGQQRARVRTRSSFF